jgi:AraC family transcriptional regulator
MWCRFAQAISLADISEGTGVSRFYLSRDFGLATGHTVMDYSGAFLALPRHSCGGSRCRLRLREAFPQAFRDQFGLTPRNARAQGRGDNLELVEPIRMEQALLVELEVLV